MLLCLLAPAATGRDAAGRLPRRVARPATPTSASGSSAAVSASCATSPSRWRLEARSLAAQALGRCSSPDKPPSKLSAAVGLRGAVGREGRTLLIRAPDNGTMRTGDHLRHNDTQVLHLSAAPRRVSPLAALRPTVGNLGSHGWPMWSPCSAACDLPGRQAMRSATPMVARSADADMELSGALIRGSWFSPWLATPSVRSHRFPALSLDELRGVPLRPLIRGNVFVSDQEHHLQNFACR